MLDSRTLARLANSVLSVGAAVPREHDLTREMRAAAEAVERGFFTPEEDELVRGAFAQYVSARAALLETLGELRPYFEAGVKIKVDDRPEAKQTYVIAFAASAILMRAATFLVDKFAKQKVIWRKLDEEESRFGLPQKQFSEIYGTVTDPDSVWTFHHALKRFDELRPEFEETDGYPDWFAPIFDFAVAEREWQRISFSRWRYVRRRLHYRYHDWKRRNRSSWENVLFSMMELGGTTVSEIRNPFHAKRVTPETVAKVAGMLRPGDVLVTRHDDAMTNLFLPGFWPHVALCIGDSEQRGELGIEALVPEADSQGRPIRMLEAKKDGVRFRALEETLSVDAFVVLRPNIEHGLLKTALERSISHEGKLYDFNFDFTKAERLVCTEVIYRGFDGMGDLRFQLTKRSGRMSFAAEDLLDLAVEDRGYEVLAIAGLSSNDLAFGDVALDELVRSYRVKKAEPQVRVEEADIPAGSELGLA